MFPVKHTVIYTFFAITSVQNTCFCSVFNALASKNPAKSCYVQCFFHFWPFFHCRKATKMTQNSISIPSWAQTPKNPRKMSKTPPNSGLGAKPFLGSGLGAKPFLAPPPAKADIATAILTNVIEHLVLLLPPNKHAFTAKAVWADFGRHTSMTQNLHLPQTCFFFGFFPQENPTSCGDITATWPRLRLIESPVRGRDCDHVQVPVV